MNKNKKQRLLMNKIKYYKVLLSNKNFSSDITKYNNFNLNLQIINRLKSKINKNKDFLSKKIPNKILNLNSDYDLKMRNKLIINTFNKEIYYFKRITLLNEIAKDKLVYIILNQLFSNKRENIEGNDIIFILSKIIFKHINNSILFSLGKRGEVIIYFKVYSNLAYRRNLRRFYSVLFNNILTLNNKNYIKNLTNKELLSLEDNQKEEKGYRTFLNKSTNLDLTSLTSKAQIFELLHLHQLDIFYKKGNQFILHKLNWFVSYLEYHLSKIYNKGVKFKIIQLNNPSLNSEILGKNIKILFSKEEAEIMSWSRLVKILSKSIKISKPVYAIPIGLEDNYENEKNLFQPKAYENYNSIFDYFNSKNYYKSINSIRDSKLSTEKINLRKNKTLSLLNLDPILGDKIKINNLINKSNIETKLNNFNFYNSNKKDNELWNFIIYFIMNNIQFKYLSGIRISLSGRMARRKMATRTKTYLFFKGTSKYSSLFNKEFKRINNNNIKFNQEFSRIYSINKNGLACFKIWLSYTS
jgi:hypothetical protein